MAVLYPLSFGTKVAVEIAMGRLIPLFFILLLFNSCNSTQSEDIRKSVPDPDQNEVQHNTFPSSSPTVGPSPTSPRLPRASVTPEPSPVAESTGNPESIQPTPSPSLAMPSPSSAPSPQASNAPSNNEPTNFWDDPITTPSTSPSVLPSISPPTNPTTTPTSEPTTTPTMAPSTIPSNPPFHPSPVNPTPAPTPAPTPSPTSSFAPEMPAGMAQVHKVVLLMLESSNIPNSTSQPFLQNLAAKGALLTNYSAVAHPNLPNYLALISGDTQEVTSDKPANLNALHIGDLLEKKNLRWKAFAENYPGNCFLDEFYSTSETNTPIYARKHVPFLNFINVQNNIKRCNDTIVNAEQFNSLLDSHQLPDFSFYIPPFQETRNTIQNDEQLDKWLSKHFNPFLNDSFTQQSILLVVIFGEGATDHSNQSRAIFYGAGVHPGTLSLQHYDHYSVLLTLEKLFNLESFKNNDLKAKLIDDIWNL